MNRLAWRVHVWHWPLVLEWPFQQVLGPVAILGVLKGRVDYSLQSDPEHRVVLVTLGKTVTEESARAAYAAVERFIANQGPHSGITDLSGVVKLKVSAEFVRHLAAKPPMIPEGMWRIAVAPRTDIYGMSRMFQILREGQGAYLEVVHTLKEAFDLLGLQSPHFSPVTSVSCAGGLARHPKAP